MVQKKLVQSADKVWVKTQDKRKGAEAARNLFAWGGRKLRADSGCNTSPEGTCAYICTWGSLYCMHIIIISKLWLPLFCIHLWEVTGHPQNPVYILKCISLWNSVMWVLLLAFSCNKSTVSITETIYTVHLSIFIIRKHYRQFA